MQVEAAMAQMGFESFRSTDQRKLIGAITNGKDALGILPTGAGKSACFIIPTLANNWKTVVVSPLIALMEDQVKKLRAQGVMAFALHGDALPHEWMAAVYAVRRPGAVFIYAAPETLLTENFAKHFKGFHPDFLAIDEAHCVSTWGDTFRPSYLRLKEVAKRLGDPQCAAFSATIDPRIEADVLARLPLHDEKVRVVASPFRENLAIEVRRPGDHLKLMKDRNFQALLELRSIMREEKTGAIIVYCYSREQSASVYNWCMEYATKRGYTPILYHAQIPAEDKRLGLELFTTRPRPIVFCTSAFGMGIDRADVRAVIHFDSPTTLVDYAQQIGRAGRDGLPARCITFYNERRVEKQEAKAIAAIPDMAFIERIHGQLAKWWLKSGKSPTFTVTRFSATHQKNADLNMEYPGPYKEMLVSTLAFLRKVGYFQDNREEGFQLFALQPGGARYQKLIELTEMAERRHQREVVRLKRFFENSDASQTMLWHIIGEA